MKEFFDSIMDDDHNPTHARIKENGFFKFFMDILYPNKQDYDLEDIMGALYGMDSFMDNSCWKVFMNQEISGKIAQAMSIYDIKQKRMNNIIDVNEVTSTINQSLESTFKRYKKESKNLIINLEDLIR